MVAHISSVGWPIQAFCWLEWVSIRQSGRVAHIGLLLANVELSANVGSSRVPHLRAVLFGRVLHLRAVFFGDKVGSSALHP